MKYLQKIRIVFIPYLLACIVSIVGLGLFRWLFEIRFRILHLQEVVYIFLIPVFISLIVALTVIRRRVHVLWIKWRDGKGYEFSQSFCGFMLFGMLAFSQYFVSTAFYDLVRVNNVSEIDPERRLRYYSIINPEISTEALEYADHYTTGRFNTSLHFRMFFACPIKDVNNSNLYWYGVRYDENASNNNESAFEGFIENKRLEFSNYKFLTPTYYEDVPNSNIRLGYYNAIAERFKIPIEKLFILEPQYEPFENRYRTSLIGFLITFGFGHLVFLWIVLKSKINEPYVQKFKDGTLVINDDLVNYTRYLIPKKPHFQTSILIDLLLVYHVIIVITGTNILSPTAYELYRAGGITAGAFEDGEYWRLITSMFIHSGIIHLFNNVFALGICGYLLEKYTKTYWFVIIYLACGVVSTFISLLWHNNSVLVGASGAIFGLYGLMIAFLVRKVIPFEEKVLYFMALVFFAGISMIMGFVLPNVNNAAHIAGLVAGVICGFFIPTKPDETRNDSCEQTTKSLKFESAHSDENT